jgi:predicted regulator of Ras-like GTPase activity (Roadblock/LC7/MglB family)
MKPDQENQTQLTEPIITPSTDDQNSAFANLATSLAEIRKLKGVTGYILRSDSSAIIDLNEKDKVIEYALLSTEINEYGSTVAKQLELGDTESVLVEGKDVKVLTMNVNGNRISIFMEKTATHAWIIKRILL